MTWKVKIFRDYNEGLNPINFYDMRELNHFEVLRRRGSGTVTDK